ncbi:restriction endonuclease subunit S [Vibrio breoganii]|uniref:restriction endonuclease subunit S n=1 Tax=Vibrio breoganii TaxID=553239 RepID=UPI000C827F61|nr:restriction endonuclease subunit S [Vibrio breoganii]
MTKVLTWPEVELGDVIDLFDSKRIPLSGKERSTRQGKYPYFGASGVIDYIDDYIFDGEYLLVAEDGENLNSRKLPIAFWGKGKFWVNNHAHILRGKKGLANTDFIKHWLLQANISGYITGAAQPKLNQANLCRIKLALPSIETQNAIAEKLSNYDNLIENNNRRIAILEDIAQSLYREWFVKFRYPGHEDNPDADGNAKLVDSPLGQIPEGWDVKRLDDYVILQRGFDLPKKKRNEQGSIPIYAASGINGFHDEAKAKGVGVVTGRSGTLGVVKLVLEDYWPLNTSLWVKEFKGCTAYYAYYLLSSMGLERFNSGASVPTLNRNDVHGNPVIAPPQDLIDKFEEIVAVNHRQINVLERKNKNLKQQRDMLLPKLISGQIELSGVDDV